MLWLSLGKRCFVAAKESTPVPVLYPELDTFGRYGLLKLLLGSE